MQEESVVYGCIKDSVYRPDGIDRIMVNREAMASLPSADSWPLLCREMFTSSSQLAGDISQHTEIVHFGAPYQGIEYEWQLWIEQFEALLHKMYWVSAYVHLETEMSGVHSFIWESINAEYHSPGSDDIQLRCEWVKEAI